jgi:hypothetical protein
LTQALDDLPLLDRVVAQFDPTLPLANHRVRRDLRRARILIQLHRLEEAADQIGALFDRHAGPSLDQNLLILLIGVTNLGRACSAAGKPGLILPHVDRALGVTQSHLAEHPDDLSIWRGRFELLAQKIQMREQQQDPLAGDLVEQEWLRFAREFCSQPTPPELPLRIARLQLMQRIAELSATRSTPFARENLVLWSRGIAAFRDGGAAPTPNSSLNSRDTPQGNHRAELVVQQVDCLTKHVRVGLPVEAPAPFQLPGWREALQAASLYLDERPDDQATRLRLAWSLVDHARCALSHDARRSLEAAQEAHQVLAPLAGHTGPDTEGRLLLADALYLSASALRKLGRLIECRLDLERAYLFSRGGNRDTIAADLVGVNVALGDQTAARKAAGWILSDGPQLKEARRLLGEMTTAQVPQ